MLEHTSPPDTFAKRGVFFSSDPIWTPEISKQCQFVASCILADYGGILIYGMQRAGKTEFARALMKLLPALLGHAVKPFLWSFLGSEIRGPEDFLRTCLSASGCDAIAARGIPILRLRLVKEIVAAARRCAALRVVLIIDEVQNISAECYKELMAITAELVQLGFIPTVISLGQPEMEQTVETYLQLGALQHVGRFFPRSVEFQSLDCDEVEELLDNMEGKGTSVFTGLHFPDRAAAHWSIRELGRPFREAVNLIMNKQNLTKPPLLPMGYLRPSLALVFNSLLDDPKKEPDTDLIFQCLGMSGLTPVIHHYVER